MVTIPQKSVSSAPGGILFPAATLLVLQLRGVWSDNPRAEGISRSGSRAAENLGFFSPKSL